MNINDYEKFGVSGVILTGAYTVVRWVVKRLDASEQYNKDRDKADTDLIQGLSGVIKENNITNKLILDKLNEILIKLEKLRWMIL